MLRTIRRRIWRHSDRQQAILDYAQATRHGVKFSQAIQDCPWLKHKGFSFGEFGWGMDALALHNLFRILEDVRPRRIVELGLGLSSKMIHQYAHYHNVNAVTVEHNAEWIACMKTSAPHVHFTIVQADMEKINVEGVETHSSRNMANIVSSVFGGTHGESCLVILDGYSSPRYSRPQIFDVLPHLGKDFCIFMHDSQRGGEQETLSLLRQRLRQMGIAFLTEEYAWSSVQQHTIVCSESWRFLTSI